MKGLERDVLMAFPEQAVQRMAFVRSLPVRWGRGAVDHAMDRLLAAGLIERRSRGVYALTDAGRAERQAVGVIPQRP